MSDSDTRADEDKRQRDLAAARVRFMNIVNSAPDAEKIKEETQKVMSQHLAGNNRDKVELFELFGGVMDRLCIQNETLARVVEKLLDGPAESQEGGNGARQDHLDGAADAPKGEANGGAKEKGKEKPKEGPKEEPKEKPKEEPKEEPKEGPEEDA